VNTAKADANGRPRRRLPRPNVRRAAPALPNGFTLGNLFFGIFAIIAASRQEFSQAVLYIVIGAVCDAFDGRVARATGTGSRFGEELDSLVDGISFGLAPAMIIYFSVLDPAARSGGPAGWNWLPVFLFCACALLRLARFNVTQAGRSKAYFEGLPSPAAGGTLATFFWFSQTPLYSQTFVGDLPWHEIVKYLMILLALLMVTKVPYPAWPKIGLRSWQGLLGLLFVVVTVVGITFYAKYYFFLAGIAYVVFGLVRVFLLGMLGRRAVPDFPEDADEIEDEEPVVALASRVPPRINVADYADELAPVEFDDEVPDVETAAEMEERAVAKRRRRRRRRNPPAGGASGTPPAGE
jgi:CDP-diacylglycerol--serine O-phosphatidyltransferase